MENDFLNSSYMESSCAAARSQRLASQKAPVVSPAHGCNDLKPIVHANQRVSCQGPFDDGIDLHAVARHGLK